MYKGLTQTDMAHRQQCCRVAFAMLHGVNTAKAEAILQKTGDERVFFEMPAADLEQMFGVMSPLFDRSYRDKLLDAAEKELEFNSSKNIRGIYFNDADYPRLLRQCEDAPLMLYGVGECDLNNCHPVSIVGTRHATHYGITFVNRLVSDLAETVDNVVIISGLAYGIDVAAHKAALSAGIPTIAVVAHGLNMIYPSAHRDTAVMISRTGGMVLTEYTHGAPVHKGNFLARNRIVAGLSECTVIAESAVKGGALVTARLASEYGREVFAVPGRTTDIYSIGCNTLISRQSAHLLADAASLVRTMGWATRPADGQQAALFPELTTEEALIVEYMRRKGGSALTDISADTGIPMPRLMSLTMNLEFKKVLVSNPGGHCSLC